jgi:hypothetical protein
LVVVLLAILSLEREPARETLWSTTLSSSTRHATAKAVESTTAAASSTTTHLSTKHLHEDLRIDATHPSTHATSKALHGVHQVITAIISSTFPICC